MKKFKKVMALILATLMTGSCLAGATLTTSAEPTETVEYSENAMPGNRTDYVVVSYKSTISYRANINYDFHAFSFVSRDHKPGDTLPYCTFSLYKWDTSLEKTLAGEPIVSHKFENLVDGATNKLEFDTPPAGEYLSIFPSPAVIAGWIFIAMLQAVAT